MRGGLLPDERRRTAVVSEEAPVSNSIGVYRPMVFLRLYMAVLTVHAARRANFSCVDAACLQADKLSWFRLSGWGSAACPVVRTSVTFAAAAGPKRNCSRMTQCATVEQRSDLVITFTRKLQGAPSPHPVVAPSSLSGCTGGSIGSRACFVQASSCGARVTFT